MSEVQEMECAGKKFSDSKKGSKKKKKYPPFLTSFNCDSLLLKAILENGANPLSISMNGT